MNSNNFFFCVIIPPVLLTVLCVKFFFDRIFIKMDEKHNKYMSLFEKNDIYWGIGIENELYMTFEKKINVDNKFINKIHRRERYSVDYFTNYKKEILKDLNKYMIYTDVPILVNSNSFTKTDINNNAKTTYTKNPQPNPLFSGKTLIESLTENDSFFEENKNYVFDGDTIEIMTFNFYKAKIGDVLNELKYFKELFLKKVQEGQKKLGFFTKYGKIIWMEYNYPMGRFLTNFNNMGIFCNGTIHFNITLPTSLDNNNDIRYMDKFVYIHKIFIRLIQYFEPIMIAIYGSPDPFSEHIEGLSKASQRVAVSRYIGLGTYDTDNMETGKILSFSSDNYPTTFWYNLYHQKCNYEKLERIGLDINFNKFRNHGVEIRFFDHMSDDNIKESLEFLCFLGDVAMEMSELNIQIKNPIYDIEWNKFVVKIFEEGINTIVSDTDKNIYEKIFDIKTETNLNVVDFYREIQTALKQKYNSKLFTRNIT